MLFFATTGRASKLPRESQLLVVVNWDTILRTGISGQVDRLRKPEGWFLLGTSMEREWVGG
jgi:hypothetical protein